MSIREGVGVLRGIHICLGTLPARTKALGLVAAIALGLTFAGSDQGIVFAIPYVTLVVFVVIAIAAGVLAAILPALRASRLNILEALNYE